MLPAGEVSAPEAFRALLERRAPAFGLTLLPPVLERLSRFLAALDFARRLSNLTGPLTSQELVDHALESALGERLIPHGARVIDIGSGAGFPGLVLAALRPDLRVTPVEPRKKRAEFLRQASAAVPLKNVDSPEKSLARLAAGSADAATARAVGSIGRILADAPFLKEDGLFLAWTTDAEGLANRLAGHFGFKERLPIPQSRQKVIAAFCKRSVPRGTKESRHDPG